MIIKYFDSGRGRSGVVEYILDKRRARNGKVRVLRGNPYITAELIKTNNNKLKYSSGVIAFEEEYIEPELKNIILDMFEKNTFAGLDKEQYNVLFVEDLDGDKTNIHFIIPRLELTSTKSYNPHWYKVDQERLLLLQDVINNKYNLSNPFVVNKANAFEIPKNWDAKKPVKDEINEVITQAIMQGQIQNREQVAQFLERSGLEIKRNKKGELFKSYILVREQGTKNYIKLRGVYYNESFTSTRAVERELASREKRHIPASQEELRTLEQKLERAIYARARYNNENYPKRKQKPLLTCDTNLNSTVYFISGDVNRGDISTKNSNADRSESSDYQQSTSTQQKFNNYQQGAEANVRISQESMGVEYDRIRATLTQRARERTGALQILGKSCAKDARGLQSDIEFLRKHLRRSYIKSANNAIRGTKENSRPIFNEARENVRERRKRGRIRKRFGESIEYFGSTLSKFSTTVQERHRGYREQLEQCNEQSEDLVRAVKEAVNKKEGIESVIAHYSMK